MKVYSTSNPFRTAGHSVLKKIEKLFLFTFLLLSITLACSGRSRAKTQAPPPAVAVVPVEQGTVSRSIQLLGVLQGEEQVTVYSKITGRVTAITKPEGSTVQADEPIGYVVNDIPGMDYKPGPVRSPIAGTVGKVYVEVGQTVAPTVPFAAVARFSNRVKMKALVSEADLPYVRLNARAQVSFSAVPDTTFTGIVTRVAPMLDPLARSATVEITIANPGRRLVPGMAGIARLTVEEKKDAVRIPAAALFVARTDQVVVVADSIARFRPVRLGLQGDEWIAVIEGLTPGELVATTGKEGLKDGQKVNPVLTTQTAR